MKERKKYIDGKQHRLCVLQVTKSFPNGTPREMTRMSEHGSVHLKGGEEFVTAWIPEENFDPKPMSPSPLGQCAECGADVVRKWQGYVTCKNGHKLPAPPAQE